MYLCCKKSFWCKEVCNVRVSTFFIKKKWKANILNFNIKNILTNIKIKSFLKHFGLMSREVFNFPLIFQPLSFCKNEWNINFFYLYYNLFKMPSNTKNAWSYILDEVLKYLRPKIINFSLMKPAFINIFISIMLWKWKWPSSQHLCYQILTVQYWIYSHC